MKYYYEFNLKLVLIYVGIRDFYNNNVKSEEFLDFLKLCIIVWIYFKIYLLLIIY